MNGNGKSLKKRNIRTLTHEHGNICSRCKQRGRERARRETPNILLWNLLFFVSLFCRDIDIFFAVYHGTWIKWPYKWWWWHRSMKIKWSKQHWGKNECLNLNMRILFCIQFSCVLWNGRRQNKKRTIKWKCKIVFRFQFHFYRTTESELPKYVNSINEFKSYAELA